MDLFADVPAASSKADEDSGADPLFGDLGVGKKRNKANEVGVTDHLFGDLPTVGHDVVSKETSPSQLTISQHVEQEQDITTTPLSIKRKSTDKSHEDVTPYKQVKSQQDKIRVQGYFAERKGEREEMQDAHVIIDDFHQHVKNTDDSIQRLAYYAVFDGHAGSKASAFAAQHLHTHLAAWFPKGDINAVEKEIKKSFVESFKKTDETFLREATKQKPSWKDGSTAVCVLAINDTLYIANLGDSKAVVCRYNESQQKWTAIPLSKDHSPTQYEERMRIQKAGGHVREGRVMGVLEVSRSIGDGPYKSHGVSCVPDVKRCQLTDKDRFLLIACDGLWKRFDSQASVDFVNKILTDESIDATEFKSVCDMRYDTACNRLASEAVRRLSADNVTVLLVALGQHLQPKT